MVCIRLITMVRNIQNEKRKPIKTEQIKVKDTLVDDSKIWWKDKTNLLLIASLLVVTFIVLSPVLNAGFVLWDDDYNVFENLNIKALTFQNIKTIFTTACGSNYNPLTTLSFAIEHYFIKLDPFYYHLHNLILHLINTLLVFWFMMLIGLKRYWAFVVALLFGIHPMHVESVAWITERKDVLYALFYLAAIINYIYYQRLKNIKYLLLIYTFFLFSLLAKIQAVSLPLTLLTIDYLMKRPLKFNLLIEKIPYFLLSFAVGLLGIHFLKSSQSLDYLNYNLFERIMLGSASLCIYLYKIIVPINLSIVHNMPMPGKFASIYYITPFIIIFIGIIVYLYNKNSRAITFGILFFLFNIVFLLQMVPAGNAYNAERFSYISGIGLFYIIVYVLEWFITKRKNLKTPIITSLTIIILIFSFISYTRAQQWKNTETLFSDAKAKEPTLPIVYTVRARYYIENKNQAKAISDLTSSLNLEVNDHAYIQRGVLYFELNDYDNALTDFNIAISHNTLDSNCYFDRGLIYLNRLKLDSALKDFNKALTINPTFNKAIGNRATAYFQLKQYENSIKDCNAVLEKYPEKGFYYNLKALSEVELKQYEQALKDYDFAIKTGFDEGLVYSNRSQLYFKMGEKANALNDALKAKSLGQDVSPEYIEYLKH